MRSLILCLVTILAVDAYGQDANQKILYIIDSIAITGEPDETEGILVESDIETMNIVTNKADIEQHGYKEMDKLIFIITKEYINRPEALKKIPTTRKMDRRNGQWYLANSTVPYSGPFIDYYVSGKKQGEGTLKNGVLNGRRSVYYQNGNLTYYTHFVNGIETGESKEYFINGALHQEVNFKNGKHDGLWKEWYSTGTLKRQAKFDEGKVIGTTKEEEKFYKLVANGTAMFREGNYDGAIKAYDKAIDMKPNYSDLYFHRGTAYLNDSKFDEAIDDYDKAIELEPLYKEAWSNRAFTRLAKYELKGSRVIGKSSGVTVLAGKTDISKEEQDKICADLNKGVELGDDKPTVLEAIKNYCK